MIESLYDMVPKAFAKMADQAGHGGSVLYSDGTMGKWVSDEWVIKESCSIDGGFTHMWKEEAKAKGYKVE